MCSPKFPQWKFFTFSAFLYATHVLLSVFNKYIFLLVSTITTRMKNVTQNNNYFLKKNVFNCKVTIVSFSSCSFWSGIATITTRMKNVTQNNNYFLKKNVFNCKVTIVSFSSCSFWSGIATITTRMKNVTQNNNYF